MMSYESVHQKMRKQKGLASDQTCPCGKPARDWAYQHTALIELISPLGQPYSEDPEDYLAMCRKCHREFDLLNTPRLVEALHRGGRNRGIATQKRRREDPEFSERMQAIWKEGRGGRAVSEKWKTDPEFAEYMRQVLRESGSRGGSVRRNRYLSDPEFAEEHRKFMAEIAKSGRDSFLERLKTDPEFAEKRKALLERIKSLGGEATKNRWKDDDFREKMIPSRAEGGRAASRIRRRCLDCGLETSPGPMGAHLRAGHSGYENVE